MSENTNIEIARRILAACDANDDSVVDELIHPDHREHAGPEPQPGREGVRGSIAWLNETFAGCETVVEDLIASGDRVVARVRFCATFTGEVQGIDARGRRVEVDHVHIWRVAEGRLAEHWMVRDDLSMLRQLGAAQTVA
jgi:predicted ester cyclase